jgi:hypothetical protein
MLVHNYMLPAHGQWLMDVQDNRHTTVRMGACGALVPDGGNWQGDPEACYPTTVVFRREKDWELVGMSGGPHCVEISHPSSFIMRCN